MPQTNENWEKEFDEKFSTFNLNDAATYNGREWHAKDLLKSFISSLLLQDRTALIERVRRGICSKTYKGEYHGHREGSSVGGSCGAEFLLPNDVLAVLEEIEKSPK